jgi:N-carbamoyl-L-amino-acid hydrolase
MASGVAERFAAEFAALAAIGREADGYHRAGWSPAELAARQWFAGRAAQSGLRVEGDGNGNLYAWWGDPDAGEALLLGSHLDTVPAGGAYDGALGVVSGLVALAEVAGRRAPGRPVVLAAFTEEEGSRFGMATLGSRLACGAVRAADVLDRTDADGISLAEAVRRSGADPAAMGPSPQLARVSAVVELHIEQGRALADLAAPLGVGSRVWPHGRWAFRFTGRADHAGTTRLADRRDPMIALAALVGAARAEASARAAVATVGRVRVAPNAANAIPGRVDCWLDARAADETTLDALVDAVTAAARGAAAAERLQTEVHRESHSPAVEFDPGLRRWLAALVSGRGLAAPEIPTAAGHDAATLAAGWPAAMVFVRNPTGVSHSPQERAEDADCVTGCELLAELVEEWVGG